MKEKLLILGSSGMVGSSVARLAKNDFSILSPNRRELDLFDKVKVDSYFKKKKPSHVINCAAKAGGIYANSTFPADFIYENLLIQNNIIFACHKYKVKRLVFLGSSCIYPKLAPQPLKEEYLLNGYLEPTNEPYAIAKIAGIKLCEAYRAQYGCNFISVMPTNLYGYGDNYDLNNSHVLPALLRKFHEAAESNASSVEVWGSGTPKREFLFADDLADACVFLMHHYDGGEIINIGTGEDVSIRELAEQIKSLTRFAGEISFNASQPDGTPRKLLDVSRLHNLGWKHRTPLAEGLEKTYASYMEQVELV
jgi:GDP-L-fucose synthase